MFKEIKSNSYRWQCMTCGYRWAEFTVGGDAKSQSKCLICKGQDTKLIEELDTKAGITDEVTGYEGEPMIVIL